MTDGVTACRCSRRYWQRLAWLPLAAMGVLGTGCGRKPAPPPPPPRTAAGESPVAVELARQLAAARVTTAKGRLAEQAPDEALAWGVNAVATDPESAEAAELVRTLLAGTRWPVATWELDHGMTVTQLAVGGPGTLWVALAEEGVADGFNTVVRWDTAAMRIEAILFPATGSGIQSMVAGAHGRALVLQRGSGEDAVHLLCDGRTMRPVCELGKLPPELAPEAVTVTSASGLLLAHPEQQAGDASRLVWRIRDVATGGIVRSSDPVGPEIAKPVAAWLDDHRLRVLLKDGALAEVPVSAAEPVVVFRPTEPATVLQARFSEDGNSILGLWARGDGRAPQRRAARFEPTKAGDQPMVAWMPAEAAPAAAWWETPWYRQAPWWDSLLRDHGVPLDPPALRIQAGQVRFGDGRRAPVRGTCDFTAVAFGSDAIVTGTRDGRVRMDSWLPLPGRTETPADGRRIEAAAVPAVVALGAVLTGLRVAPEDGRLVAVEPGERAGWLEKLTSLPMAEPVPGLELSGVVEALRKCRLRTPAAGAWQPLWDRLARADPTGRSWPRWLARGQALGDTRWHQDLTEALALRQGGSDIVAERAGDNSPWLAQRRMRGLAGQADEAAWQAELEAAGGKGPAMATALALALDGDRTARLEACLRLAKDLPPLLRVLAQSRIAWLERRPADALSLWPDEFPRLARIRAGDDWDGWEQEDFQARYDAHLKDLAGALAAYDVAAAKSPADREQLALKLLDPATRGVIGRRRLADHCLKGALAMAELAEKPELIHQLAKRARELGGAAEPSLRVEALTHTRMGNYALAHPLWVKLLTEYPVESHLSNDYAEAAYTAFETGDPGQALEILTTGINRFGRDAGFALRAGWIALLTGNHGRAYQFLLAGLRVGFAADQEENACLLLAVAASLAGFPEDAATHFLRLVEVQPEWEKPETAETLEWPEELKVPIRQLISGPVIELPEQPADPTMEPLPE